MLKQATVIVLFLFTAPAHATEDPSRPLAGTWTLVTVDNILADGRRIQPYGPHPEGMLTFDADGHYAIQIFHPDRPRFASNDKARGTEEENQTIVRGTNTHFGRYSVDAEKHVLTFHIDRAFFPNWERTVQQRSYVLENDILRYTVRTTTTGGTEVGEVTWKRVATPSE